MPIILVSLLEALHPTSVLLILIVDAAGAVAYLDVYLLMGANEFERAALRHAVGTIRSRASFRVAEANRSSDPIVERKSTAAALPVPDQVAGRSLSQHVAVLSWS